MVSSDWSENADSFSTSIARAIASKLRRIRSKFGTETISISDSSSDMSPLSGKVQTVLGLMDPELLGRTMTHEHLTMTFECCFTPPGPGCEDNSSTPIELKSLHWLQQNPYSHRENLLLCQEIGAVREELVCFKKAGGGTIVENTTTGITRDLPALRQLAKDTGVNIVAGAGYYVDVTHSDETRKMTVEKVCVCMCASVCQG